MLEKVDFFACSLHVGGMFPVKIVKNMIENKALRETIIKLYSIPECDLKNKSKSANHFGYFGPQLWTILDTLGPWGGGMFSQLLTTSVQLGLYRTENNSNTLNYHDVMQPITCRLPDCHFL